MEGGVEAGLEEGKEEVEEVNRVGVLGETSVWRVVAGMIYETYSTLQHPVSATHFHVDTGE